MVRDGSRGFASLSRILEATKSTSSPGWQANLIRKPEENTGFRSGFAAKSVPVDFGANMAGFLEFAGFHDSEIKC
jgi:hypothetical protein